MLSRCRALLLILALLGPAVANAVPGGNPQWSGIGTISATSTVVTNSLCYSDGRDLACDSSAGLRITSGTVAFSNISATNVSASTINGTPVGSLGGTGDRIVSGSLLAVANSATGYVSLTTGATNWGYLSSAASYIPNLSSNFVSSTSISASTAYVKNTLSVSGSTYVSDITIMGTASGAGINPSISVSASGADTQVQYNSSGSLAGSSNFTYSAGLLTLTGTVTTTNLYASSVSGTTGTFGSITVGSCTGCGGGSGDRITSGTTSMVANSATSIISITNAGVTGGYFNANGVLTLPGISATSNLTSVTTLYTSGLLQIGKGILLNQGSGATDNLMYLGSTSSGAVDASLGFFAAGLGSGNDTAGPYFLARGNNFSGISDQRGNMYFVAGGVSAPSVKEGSLNFMSNGNITRMIVDNAGNVGIGIGATLAQAKLEVLGTISASNIVVSSCTGCGGGTSDRITSGTTGITAISNTKTISITTNNVVTGYFNSNGVLTVPGISTTSNLTSVTTLSANQIQFNTLTGGTGVDPSFSVSASGADTQVQYNSSGNLAGSANFTYSSGVVTITGTVTATNVYAGSVSGTTGTFGSIGSGAINANGIVSSTGVNVTGDISYTGVLTDTSDRRLKHDIKPLPFNSAMEKLMLMKPVQFRMNDRPDRVEWGFVAQDVEQLFPNLVFTANDALGTKTLNYIGMIAPMVQGMQELQKENDDLRKRLDKLEKLVEAQQRH
jgi:hypothetical protein